MSQTITLCSKCGGAIVSNEHSYYGKRCACPRAAGGTTATATATASMFESTSGPGVGAGVSPKLCCKCGADVTHAKRMKDHLGHYWCYDCGAADQLKRGSGLALKCPDCNKHFPPTKMLKHGEEYVCEACHDERLKHKGFAFGGGGSGGGKLVKMLAALLLVGAGAVLIVSYVLDLELLP